MINIKETWNRIEAKLSLKKIIKVMLVIVILFVVGISVTVVTKKIKEKKTYDNVLKAADMYVNNMQYSKALKKINAGIDMFKTKKDYVKSLKKKKQDINKIKESSEYEQCIEIAKSESVEISDDERIDAYTKAIDIKPSEEELYISAASIFVQYNDYDKAVNLLSSGVDACEDLDNDKAKKTAINLTKKIDEINELMFNTEYNNMYLEAKMAYDEGDFDKVLQKYNQCLLKNKNDARLYVIMAKAYFDENRYSEAIKVLNTGINRLNSLGANNKNSKQYDKYKYMVKLRNNYISIQKISSKYDTFYKELLNSCKQLYKEKKIDKVKKTILKYDFKSIAGCNRITYYTDKGMYVEQLNSGMGIAVYRNRYIYYGEWKEGKKSGLGFFFAINKDKDIVETYMYQGEWLNDYPNGKGKVVYENYKDGTLKYKTTTQGSYENGLENGSMKLIKNGSSVEAGELYMKYTAVKGEPVILKENGKMKKSADGSFVIGYYYDCNGKKREISAILSNGDNPKKVYWRVNGLSYK